MSHGFTTASETTARARNEQQRAETLRMTTGPYLSEDEATIIVPSDWYSKEAGNFWKAQSFWFDRHTRQWMRSTHALFRNKQHTPQQWLEAARTHFYQFHPTARLICRMCGEQFATDVTYAAHCPACCAKIALRRKRLSMR